MDLLEIAVDGWIEEFVDGRADWWWKKERNRIARGWAVPGDIYIAIATYCFGARTCLADKHDVLMESCHASRQTQTQTQTHRKKRKCGRWTDNIRLRIDELGDTCGKNTQRCASRTDIYTRRASISSQLGASSSFITHPLSLFYLNLSSIITLVSSIKSSIYITLRWLLLGVGHQPWSTASSLIFNPIQRLSPTISRLNELPTISVVDTLVAEFIAWF